MLNPEKDIISKLDGFIHENVASGLIDSAEKILRTGNWKSVTDHCLMEAARACVLADLLDLDEALKTDLALAALLHDGHKQKEVEAIQAELARGGSGRSASNIATDKYLDELKTSGVPTRVIEIIEFSGGMPEVLLEVKKLLDQDQLSFEEIAAISMHYIDAYTRGGEWTEIAEDESNDIDKRMKKNQNNTNYKKIEEDASRILQSHPFFSGHSLFESMAVLNHEVEKKLSQLIEAKSGKKIDPLKLPEAIDSIIKEKIKS